MNNKIKTLWMLAAFAGSTIATSAAGLIGENYAGAGLAYTWVSISGISNPDGWGAGVGINHNVQKDANFGIDINGVYTYARVSGSGLRVRSNTLQASAVLFTEMDNVKPFLSLDTGWTWENARMFGLKISDDSWLWGFSGGVEIALNEAFSLTPSISWTRFNSYSDSVWSGGISGNYWINDQVSVQVGYGMTEGPEKAHTVGVSVNWRY